MCYFSHFSCSLEKPSITSTSLVHSCISYKSYKDFSCAVPFCMLEENFTWLVFKCLYFLLKSDTFHAFHTIGQVGLKAGMNWIPSWNGMVGAEPYHLCSVPLKWRSWWMSWRKTYISCGTIPTCSLLATISMQYRQLSGSKVVEARVWLQCMLITFVLSHCRFMMLVASGIGLPQVQAWVVGAKRSMCCFSWSGLLLCLPTLMWPLPLAFACYTREKATFSGCAGNFDI